MAYDVKDKIHVYETVSASGTIYLFLDDQQVLAQSFRQHIKIHVVYDKLNESVFKPGEETLYKDVKPNGSTMIEYVALPLSPCPVGQAQIRINEHHSQAVDIDKQLSESKFSNDELPMIVQEHTASNPTCSNTSKPALLDLHLISSEAVKILFSKEDEKNDKFAFIDTGDPKKRNRFSKRLSQRTSKSDKKWSSRENSKALYSKHVQAKKSKEKNMSLKFSLAHINWKKGHNNVPESIKSCAGELKQDSFDSENKDERDKPEKKTKLKKIEQEKEVSCEYCKKTFKSQHDFFEHRKVEKASYQCKHCSKVVAFKAHLLVHMRKHKTDDDRTSNTADQAHEAAMESNRSKKGINCGICGLSVSNIPVLKTHTMIHTGEFAYKCCVCGDLTHSLGKYTNHLATHLKAGQVQCKICNISFLSRSELSKHQLSHEFKCNICDKVFPNKTSRDFHYKKDHKEDILKCHICGKMYSSNDELMSHLKYHRNRSKTQCTICGLMVTRLDNHMLSHNHSVPESAMYVCDQCPKQFNQRLSFKRHMKAHSQEKPYVCIECPKRFARSGGLRRHMLTHTQERPFVCEICGKACSQMGNLRIHMQVHKDMTSVQCEECGESFSYKNALQEHMKTAHFLDVN
ncbi:unnamed protein product, partial [Lymnaea stagnalis]